MAEASNFTNLLTFVVRRIAALGTPEAFDAIVQSLKRADNDLWRLNVLRGFSVAVTVERHVRMPKDWGEVSSSLASDSNPEVCATVRSLSLTFGSSSAHADFYRTLADKSAPLASRRTALETLLQAKDNRLAPVMLDLLSTTDLRQMALQGLAAYDDEKTPEKILALYGSLSKEEKRTALNTLAARVTFARSLLTAIAKGRIARTDVTADIVRDLRNLRDVELNKEVARFWSGSLNSSAEKKAQIAKYKRICLTGRFEPGMASRGRAVFAHSCQQCHTLFGSGGKVGPELTGSHRADLDYILENIVDPNLIIPNDYKAWVLETTDDRTITGILRRQDERSVTIITPGDTLIVPRKEIRSLKQSQISMMPEGLLDNLKDQDVRDLIYYLSQPSQVPMPDTLENHPNNPIGLRGRGFDPSHKANPVEK